MGWPNPIQILLWSVLTQSQVGGVFNPLRDASESLLPDRNFLNMCSFHKSGQARRVDESEKQEEKEEESDDDDIAWLHLDILRSL